MAAPSALAVAILGFGLLVGSTHLEATDSQPQRPWSLDQSTVSHQLKEFIAAKEAQAQALAKLEGKELPPEFPAFFAAAAKGDAGSVTNLLDTMRKHYPSYGGNDQSLSETAWEPMLEVGGALEVFAIAGDKYARATGEDIIKSIPPRSIYFGGTDWGRFLITALSTSHINANPFFTITPKFFTQTQTGLITRNDNLGYLRSMYGKWMKIPTDQDVQRCVQDYASELRDRQIRGARLSPDEQVTTEGGAVQVRGVQAAMNLDAQIAKLIFDANPDREFYYEESFVIPWMYHYVEPHGLILKLNRNPLTHIDSATIEKDREFWDGLTKQLLADPEYLNNKWTRAHHAKLRSAIAGVYAYRRMMGEAEYAFKQAVALDPSSPEANFRLAQLCTEQNRFDDTIKVLTALQQRDPTNPKLQAVISQVEHLQQSKQPETPH